MSFDQKLMGSPSVKTSNWGQSSKRHTDLTHMVMVKGEGNMIHRKKINKKGSVNFICFFLLQRKCWLSLNCVLGTWAPDINCRNIGKLINSIHEMERCEKRVYSAIHGTLLDILNSISTIFWHVTFLWYIICNHVNIKFLLLQVVKPLLQREKLRFPLLSVLYSMIIPIFYNKVVIIETASADLYKVQLGNHVWGQIKVIKVYYLLGIR